MKPETRVVDSRQRSQTNLDAETTDESFSLKVQKTIGKKSKKKTSNSSRKRKTAFFKTQKNIKFPQVTFGKNSEFATGIAFFNCFSKSIFRLSKKIRELFAIMVVGLKGHGTSCSNDKIALVQTIITL